MVDGENKLSLYNVVSDSHMCSFACGHTQTLCLPKRKDVVKITKHGPVRAM